MVDKQHNAFQNHKKVNEVAMLFPTVFLPNAEQENDKYIAYL